MAVVLEKIYELALNQYHVKLVSGGEGIWNMVEWVHNVEDIDVVDFLKGGELIVIIGIKTSDDAQLLEFTKMVYQAKASGLIFNIGPYIKAIPADVLSFSKEHQFPVFTMPWDVHLVDFNRELCSLIYKSNQEHQNLDSAFQNAIYNSEDAGGYLPALKKEGITPSTKLCMIACYLPFTDFKNQENPVSKSFDVARFYHHFLQHCKKALSRQFEKFSAFHHDLYVIMVVTNAEKKEIEELIHMIYEFTLLRETSGRIYTSVSSMELKLEELPEASKHLAKLCKWNAKENQDVCFWDDMGAWKILFAVQENEKLKRYEEQMLGELERLNQESGTDYLSILENYLEQNGNVQEVAAKCFLHRNTVTYHLKKIQEITGQNLSEAKARYELYLAFQIKKMLEL